MYPTLPQDREFDIVIFGASGFVGYYAIRDLFQSIEQNPAELGALKWAVAGRCLDKLNQALAELCIELIRDLTHIANIEADVTDLQAIESMAQRTKVLLNCVGPYAQFGRPVVDACIRHGTHHLDVSAELQYIEKTQVECDQDARQSEVMIVSAVGFCSTIVEMGIQHLRNHFDGTLHSVETYVDLKQGNGVS